MPYTILTTLYAICTPHRGLVLSVLFGACALCMTGCTSVESDMPWNAPPSWQGSPTMPGLGPGGY